MFTTHSNCRLYTLRAVSIPQQNIRQRRRNTESHGKPHLSGHQFQHPDRRRHQTYPQTGETNSLLRWLEPGLLLRQQVVHQVTKEDRGPGCQVQPAHKRRQREAEI